MITRSQWRVRVASSILLVLFFAIHSGLSQSVSRDPLQKEITLRGQSLSFEDILRELTSQTKLYFIYSSNLIALNKRISLNINHRPLTQVLRMLELQMGLSFRKEGNYVVVKKGSINKEILAEVKSGSERPSQNINRNFFSETKNSTLDNSLVSHKIRREEKEILISIPHELLKKNLLHCPSDFSIMDTSVVKKYSLLKITNPHPGRQLFTSIRLIANDYSGGIEIHTGIPYLYAVINTGLMMEGYLRNGYGLGTSIPIKPRLSMHPIYTYAKVKQEENYRINANVNFVISDGLKITGKHHQMKFIFQYQASRQITIHAGPTFNFLNTSYLQRVLVGTNSSSSPAGNSYTVSPSQGAITQPIYYLPQNYSTFRSWTGFEVGVSYLIKFPHH